MIDEARLGAVLREFARTLITDFPIHRILDDLVDNVVEVLPISSAGVTLITPELVPKSVAASEQAASLYDTLHSSPGEGPSTKAYTQGDPVIIPDLRTDDRFPGFAQAGLAAGCAAVFTFPLRHGDGCIGTLDLFRDTPGELDNAELAAAQTLADVTAAYLINAGARDDARAAAEQFRLSALHDALTGLPNRELLQYRMEHAAHRAGLSPSHSAVLSLDLDRFKIINDTHGRGTGDEVLIAVARRLSALVRPGDTLARVSGDEFVFLCEDIDSEEDVEGLASEIWAAFNRPFVTKDAEISVTASVGIAFAGPGEAVSDQLVTNADMAMYEAKRTGGARHLIVDLTDAGHTADEHRLEADFRQALAEDELELAYQPIVQASDGAITGVEALLRWTDPQRGAVPPMSIIELAERSGLINDLGTWVLERACRDHVALLRRHPDLSLELAVNISALQLMAPGFAAAIARILSDTGLDPSSLVLEMTETIFLAEADLAMTVLADLKAMNVQIALDDSGTGYSSLSYLREFPVDIVKIDQSLVAEVGNDPANSAVVASLIELAHVLNLRVTVEGVETMEQSQEVRAMRPESAQGFFYSKPVSADAIADIVTQSSLPASPSDEPTRPGPGDS